MHIRLKLVWNFPEHETHCTVWLLPISFFRVRLLGTQNRVCVNPATLFENMRMLASVIDENEKYISLAKNLRSISKHHAYTSCCLSVFRAGFFWCVKRERREREEEKKAAACNNVSECCSHLYFRHMRWGDTHAVCTVYYTQCVVRICATQITHEKSRRAKNDVVCMWDWEIHKCARGTRLEEEEDWEREKQRNMPPLCFCQLCCCRFDIAVVVAVVVVATENFNVTQLMVRGAKRIVFSLPLLLSLEIWTCMFPSMPSFVFISAHFFRCYRRRCCCCCCWFCLLYLENLHTNDGDDDVDERKYMQKFIWCVRDEKWV